MSGPILLVDADSFFASVGQRDDPRLRGRPVIVGGGVVMAASCVTLVTRRADGSKGTYVVHFDPTAVGLTDVLP